MIFRSLKNKYKFKFKKKEIPFHWRDRVYSKTHKTQLESWNLLEHLSKTKQLDSYFMAKFNSLSLEEVIALKLDLASKPFGNKFYSFPLWFSLEKIVRHAVLKHIYSSSKTFTDIATFLGVSQNRAKVILWAYGLNHNPSAKNLSRDNNLPYSVWNTFYKVRKNLEKNKHLFAREKLSTTTIDK